MWRYGARYVDCNYALLLLPTREGRGECGVMPITRTQMHASSIHQRFRYTFLFIYQYTVTFITIVIFLTDQDDSPPLPYETIV